MGKGEEEERGRQERRGLRLLYSVITPPPPQDFFWHTVPCTCKGMIPFGVWEVRIVTSQNVISM